MPLPQQKIPPFSCLDFPGRTTISLHEMSARIGCSVAHFLNEVESGALCALDLKGAGASRRSIRVPVESYYAYVLKRMTTPFISDFIQKLPPVIKRDLRRQMIGACDKIELREMIAEIKNALAIN